MSQVKMKESPDFPHVFWIELQRGTGVYTESAVLKKDKLGNIYFIKLKSLDDVDRRRLANILTNRNSKSFELWDLMSQVTLGNGIGALNYFHQVVEVLSPNGIVHRPSAGVVGIADPAQQGEGVVDTNKG